MNINKMYILEIILDAIALTWLLFVLTNSNQSLGTAYQFFIYAAIFFLFVNIFIDKSVRVTFQKEKGKWFEAIFAGVLGWVAILLISFLVFKFVDPIQANFGSIVASFGAANPAFSNSKIINWITISFAIGYAETQLWARGAEFIADFLHIPINRKSKFVISYVVLVIILSILFGVFHATSKSVGNVSALLVVSIMMAVSLFMIAYFNGETRQASIAHIISNAVAGAIALYSGGLVLS